MSTKHVVILKNDAVGDLVHSLNGIYNIINNTNVDKITIFVSKLSKKFNFLFNNPKVHIKVVNYNLTIKEKIELFFFILSNKINKIYILAPKNFYYYLPIFFFNIKFYALCIENVNGYKRPSTFLRKFLYKFVINDRAAQFKRLSTEKIQSKLKDNSVFDEKIFMYLENDDLCKRVKKKNEKIFIIPDSKIKHLGAKGVSDNFYNEIELSRNWHWSWSKFYYSKKHKGYFFSLILTLPFFLRSIFKMIYNFNNPEKRNIYYARFSGLLNSYRLKKSWYRPNLKIK